MMSWCEQYLSTPAHNHVIFTNQPKALIGDYYISCNPPRDFMGTTIAFASDTFKTWEEILTFFQRIC